MTPLWWHRNKTGPDPHYNFDSRPSLLCRPSLHPAKHQNQGLAKHPGHALLPFPATRFDLPCMPKDTSLRWTKRKKLRQQRRSERQQTRTGAGRAAQRAKVGGVQGPVLPCIFFDLFIFLLGPRVFVPRSPQNNLKENRPKYQE